MRGIVSALLLVVAATATADIPDALDRASVSIGGYYPTVDTAVSASSGNVRGTTVNFQKDLQLDNHRTLLAGQLEFLVFDNQGFSVSGYEYSRRANTMLSRDVAFDGDHFQVGADIMAHLRIEVLTGAWHWWFTPTPQDVLGVGLGAVYYKVFGSIGGTLSVANASVSGYGSAGDDVVAPLATLAWRHAFSRDVRAYAEVSGVWKDGGTIRGHQANGVLGMEYFAWRNLGFALEYDANDLTLKSDRDTWEGSAHIKFYGPAAFVRARF